VQLLDGRISLIYDTAGADGETELATENPSCGESDSGAVLALSGWVRGMTRRATTILATVLAP